MDETSACGRIVLKRKKKTGETRCDFGTGTKRCDTACFIYTTNLRRACQVYAHIFSDNPRKGFPG